MKKPLIFGLILMFSLVLIVQTVAKNAPILDKIIIKDIKVKSYLASHLNKTHSNLLKNKNFLIDSKEIIGNHTRIKFIQDGKSKTMIISNRRAKEALT